MSVAPMKRDRDGGEHWEHRLDPNGLKVQQEQREADCNHIAGRRAWIEDVGRRHGGTNKLTGHRVAPATQNKKSPGHARDPGQVQSSGEGKQPTVGRW